MSRTAHGGVAVAQPVKPMWASRASAMVRRIRRNGRRAEGLHNLADAARCRRPGAYMLGGECAVYYGDDLQKRVLVHRGEQLLRGAPMCHAHRVMKREAVHLDRGAFI